MRIDITIGWTRSDPATGYSSFHGYRPGASQHEETISVDVPDELLREVELIADAVFTATNAPVEALPLGGVVETVYRAIAATGYNGREAGHYSLSVGDTVTLGEVRLACSPLGWTRVSEVAR